MSKRIVIFCSERDKEQLLMSLKDECPFHPYTDECGENVDCNDCIRDNIEFNIKEEKL